jgi:hypothetical protein
MRRAPTVAMVLFLAVSFPHLAAARRGVRPLFEPTDLELEDPGIAELDVQLGLIRGRDLWRVPVPDFELDFGLLPNLEVDIDGAFALEEPTPGSFRFVNAAPDNLWFAGKLGIFDWGDVGVAPGEGVAWAVGLQAGPKVPIMPGSRGVGVEGVVIVAHVVRRSHYAANAGGFYDPGPAPGVGRPLALEAGLDYGRPIDDAGRFQVSAALAGVRFASTFPNQLVAMGGLGWAPTDDTQFTLTAMCGFLAGSDHYGALVGFARRVRLFGGAL